MDNDNFKNDVPKVRKKRESGRKREERDTN